ncbi:hypothetical protein ABZ949_34125 [Micromonospora tulbaghiae]|uniref:hypothetical protein n=1 Tax=Micromonospora tulbaghiae TaxID=479978 RepID=UPI0033ED57EE
MTTATDAGWDAEKARQRYATEWPVSDLTIIDEVDVVWFPVDATSTRLPSRYSRFTVHSRGLVVVVSGTAVDGETLVYLDGGRPIRPLHVHSDSPVPHSD